MLTQQLKSFDADKLGMEELVELAAYGRLLHEQYSTLAVPVPDWLPDSLSRLGREILAKRQDSIEKRLKDIRAQRTQLLSADEKRRMLDAEAEVLERQLRGEPVAK